MTRGGSENNPFGRYGIPAREQHLVTGKGTRAVRYCACHKPEKDCPNAVRHNFMKWREQCLKDPRWKDPAPFPVPKD